MRESQEHRTPPKPLFDSVPEAPDPTPTSVRAGRTVSATLLFGWPWALLAAVTTLRATNATLVSTCSSSWWGFFLCSSTAYPLIFVVSTLVSRSALRARALALAVFAAWAPALGMLYVTWKSEMFTRVF